MTRRSGLKLGPKHVSWWRDEQVSRPRRRLANRFAEGEDERVTKVKWYWGLTFTIGTVLTIAVNGAHAKGVLAVSGTNTAMAVAACPPVVFAVVVKGYFLVRRYVSKNMRLMVKLSAGGLGAAAFAVSYETSRLFVIAEPGPLPEWTGWVIPAMVDVLVAVSGLVLYVLAEHEPTATVENHEPTSASRFSRLAEAATRRVEARLAVTNSLPELSEDVREPAPEPAAKPEPKAPSEVREPVAKPKAKVREPAANPELEPFLPAAKWMLERREVTRKSEHQVAAIIKLVNDGLNSYEIRKQVGGSTDTADKVSRAWQRWLSEQVEVPHQLEAVS